MTVQAAAVRSPGESSQTLDRGLQVLELLGGADRPMSVAEIAAGLGVGRAVVYRLLAALDAHGMVRRSDDGRVRLGFAVLELARRVQPELRAAAHGPLRTLAEQVGATAHLTVVDGDEALAVAVVEPSWTEYHVAYRVGSRHPLDRGAAGRAIQLGRSDAGPTAVASLGELQPGAHGLAAPVLGIPGLEASVGVVALTELDPEATAPPVLAAAAAVARRLA